MTRALLRALALILFVVGLGGANCGIATCPTGLSATLAAFGEHIATKIPLNSQSDCSGASRVPLNDQSVGADGSGPALFCYVESTDPPCASCLGLACCGAMNLLCSAETSGAACAAFPAVSTCFDAAWSGRCAAVCSFDAGAGGGGS